MKLQCAIEGCDGAVDRREWCTKHYSRFIRHGDPLGGGYSRGHVKTWLQVHKDWRGCDCLIWPFYRDPQGYARCNHNGRDQIASRVMCEKAHGAAPTTRHEAAHLCGKGHEGCVNPSHLVWALHGQNEIHKAEHGTSIRGERHPFNKLSERQVREVKRRLKRGASQRGLAREYQVSQSAIHLIAKGKNWAWVTC